MAKIDQVHNVGNSNQ